MFIRISKGFFLLLLVLLLSAAALWLGSLVPPELLQQLLSRLERWAAPAYILLFTLLPVFFFPVAVLALAGGLLFGLWKGSLYTFLGAMLNCSLMFLLSRYWGRDKAQAYVRRSLSPAWQHRLEQAGGRRGFFLLVLLRLIPAVPYNLINYAFGLTSMSLPKYLLGSALGIIPGTFAFINLGDQALSPGSPGFWLALGLLAALTVLTALLGKFCFPKGE